MKAKIKDRKELVTIVRELREQGKRIVFTNGCFDLLHLGHIRYLEKAREEGDVLIVGLNSDRSVRELKGENRPLIPQSERAELLAALSMVDFVSIFEESTPLELIRAVKPDVLVKGGDWKREHIVGAREVEEIGGKLVIVPAIPGHSTRNLIAEISQKFRSDIEI